MAYNRWQGDAHGTAKTQGSRDGHCPLRAAGVSVVLSGTPYGWNRQGNAAPVACGSADVPGAVLGGSLPVDRIMPQDASVSVACSSALPRIPAIIVRITGRSKRA